MFEVEEDDLSEKINTEAASRRAISMVSYYVLLTILTSVMMPIVSDCLWVRNLSHWYRDLQLI
jgi:hypothetical protein